MYIIVFREYRTISDPWTPVKDSACSKRSFDGQIKKWRRQLHAWDPEAIEASDDMCMAINSSAAEGVQ